MPRNTHKEMFPLIEEWENSNESREAFCHRHNLQLSTFSYWRSRYIKSKVRPATSFVELQPNLGEDLEIIYPNGVKIRLTGNSPLSQIQALIRLV